MKLLIEELDEHLPKGWVLLRRTPDTDPAHGFLEMHFTGDVDLRDKIVSLEQELEECKSIASELAAVRDAAREVLYRDASADEHRILRNKLRQLSPEAREYQRPHEVEE